MNKRMNKRWMTGSISVVALSLVFGACGSNNNESSKAAATASPSKPGVKTTGDQKKPVAKPETEKVPSLAFDKDFKFWSVHPSKDEGLFSPVVDLTAATVMVGAAIRTQQVLSAFAELFDGAIRIQLKGVAGDLGKSIFEYNYAKRTADGIRSKLAEERISIARDLRAAFASPAQADEFLRRSREVSDRMGGIQGELVALEKRNAQIGVETAGITSFKDPRVAQAAEEVRLNGARKVELLSELATAESLERSFQLEHKAALDRIAGIPSLKDKLSSNLHNYRQAGAFESRIATELRLAQNAFRVKAGFLTQGWLGEGNKLFLKLASSGKAVAVTRVAFSAAGAFFIWDELQQMFEVETVEAPVDPAKNTKTQGLQSPHIPII